MDLGLNEKIAFVGGSSRGLGFAVARELLSEGARVSVCGRHTESVEQAVAELGQFAPAERILGQAGDFGDAQQLVRLLNTCEQHFGGLDIVIGNAGGPPASPVLASSWDDWQVGIDAHLKAALVLARESIPRFRKNGWGRLLFITSVAVKQPIDNLGISNSVRAAVVGLAKTLSREVGHPQITVNCLLPGYTRTERLDGLAQTLSAQSGSSPEEVFGQWESQIPLGRVAEPAEFARVAAFLASEAASYLNGLALAVDGGLSRSLL